MIHQRIRGSLAFGIKCAYIKNEPLWLFLMMYQHLLATLSPCFALSQYDAFSVMELWHSRLWLLNLYNKRYFNLILSSARYRLYQSDKIIYAMELLSPYKILSKIMLKILKFLLLLPIEMKGKADCINHYFVSVLS